MTTPPRGRGSPSSACWKSPELSQRATPSRLGLPVDLVVVAVLVGLALAAELGAGVRLGGDSGIFTDGARRLAHGHALIGKEGAYFDYVAFLALLQRLGLGLRAAVTIQALVGAVATFAVYDLGREIGGRWAGVAAAALLALDVDIARWHTYVLSDSLYISGVVISLWALHRAVERRGSWGLLAAALLLATAFLRPNGLILLPLAGVYWAHKSIADRRRRVAAIAAVVAAFGVFYGVLSTEVAGFRAQARSATLASGLRRGTVIWDISVMRQHMPADHTRSTVIYVARHPIATARLAALRVLTELGHTRPGYSAFHNVLALAVLPAAYLLAGLTLIRVRGRPPVDLLVLVIAGHLLVVAATYADYDGRFLLHVLPLIFVLAACEIAYLASTLVRNWPV